MKRESVKSSQIASVGYDPETQTLEIEFVPAKGAPVGSIYRYSNVTPAVYEEMMAAKSQGSFFITRIKVHPEKYPYERVKE